METSDTLMDRTGIQERAQEFIGSMGPPGPKCRVALIFPEDIDVIWPHVEDHIARSAARAEGELTTDDFFAFLVDGQMHLWVAIEDKNIIAAMVTQVIVYPRKKVLRIVAIGGEGMERWKQFFPMLEDFAMSLDCTSLEAWGRKGWTKILKDWKSSYIVYTYDLKKKSIH
jgi:hypothetical protein